ncbi:MAG TPA: ATP-binding cassette domain-containing protein, partial [Patescibacteria group bacterium]
MIRFEAVSKIYKGDYSALENINLLIKDGEFVSIIGSSGAGKSTLLKLIYAEEMPTSGTVFFEEIPTASLNRRKLPFFRRSIGTIFQDFKLLHR